MSKSERIHELSRKASDAKQAIELLTLIPDSDNFPPGYVAVISVMARNSSEAEFTHVLTKVPRKEVGMPSTQEWHFTGDLWVGRDATRSPLSGRRWVLFDELVDWLCDYVVLTKWTELVQPMAAAPKVTVEISPGVGREFERDADGIYR